MITLILDYKKYLPNVLYIETEIIEVLYIIISSVLFEFNFSIILEFI